jgi:hypothetical protein
MRLCLPELTDLFSMDSTVDWVKYLKTLIQMLPELLVPQLTVRLATLVPPLKATPEVPQAPALVVLLAVLDHIHRPVPHLTVSLPVDHITPLKG